MSPLRKRNEGGLPVYQQGRRIQLCRKEVPGVFTNASKAPGFVKITPLKASHRVNMKAELCEACRVGVFRY